MNPEDEVDGNAFEQRPRTLPGVGVPGAPAGGRGRATPQPSAPSARPQGAGRWGVVLATVGDDGHESVAAALRDRFAAAYPALEQAYVRSTPRGSVVMVGRFKGPDDPAARPALEQIKAISPDGQLRPFARAYLSRVQTTSESSGPLDLANARRKHPRVNPLFTVQVAMWSDFDSDTIPMDEIRRKSESYAQSLRLRGHDAYVRHDEDQRTSIVTVGVFDSSAYDPRSTLFSPPVERVFRAFPHMLVNGEELLQPPRKGVPSGAPLLKEPTKLIEIPP